MHDIQKASLKKEISAMKASIVDWVNDCLKDPFEDPMLNHGVRAINNFITTTKEEDTGWYYFLGFEAEMDPASFSVSSRMCSRPPTKGFPILEINYQQTSNLVPIFDGSDAVKEMILATINDKIGNLVHPLSHIAIAMMMYLTHDPKVVFFTPTMNEDNKLEGVFAIVNKHYEYKLNFQTVINDCHKG